MSELRAGRELDAKIAEQVMGWEDVQSGCYTPTGQEWCGTRRDDPGPWGTYRHFVPRYSTQIAAAWEVVTHLETQGFRLANLRCPHPDMRYDQGLWAANFVRDEFREGRWQTDLCEDGWGETPTEALCLAALCASRQARGAEQEETTDA